MNNRKVYFSFGGQTYRYFYGLHNKTWTNERAVEIPIVYDEVKKRDAESVLEIGNVLSYYYPVQHDIIDKYELDEQLIKADIVDFRSSKKYDLIVSISTLEHVGYDEYWRYGSKDYTRYEPSERQLRQADLLHDAIKNIKHQLSQKGKVIVTVPLGFNPVLDAIIKDKSIFTSTRYLKRLSKCNLWKEAHESEVQSALYGWPYRNANALAICGFTNNMTKQDSLFNEAYFDGGVNRLGAYSSYRFEKLANQLEYLARLIKTRLNPSNVLDIGCAKGFLVQLLEALGIPASGVDISTYAIGCATNSVRTKLHVVDLNCDPLPFNDESFDVVTLLGTIELLLNDSLVVDETWRVLKDGGSLLLKTETKRLPNDRLRTNTHEAEYWIKYLESKGFIHHNSTSVLFQKAYERNEARLIFNAWRSNAAFESVQSFLAENWPIEEVLVKLISKVLVRTHVKWLFFFKCDKKSDRFVPHLEQD